MSLSLTAVLLPTLTVLLLLQLLQCECNVNVTSAPPKITSEKDLAKLASTLNQQMQTAEKFLHRQAAEEAELKRSFKQYSTRTARHGWNSLRTQRQNAARIRRDAARLRNTSESIDRAFRRQFGRQINLMQINAKRYERNNDLTLSIERTVAVYKRIVELLLNLITCPIDIINALGGVSQSTEIPTSTTDFSGEITDGDGAGGVGDVYGGGDSAYA
ncbi:uncharacterized protein LOC131681014 [Topomyia yanbarensis]|uniref:uncharacterized protein LOC131681014 n=1 Tax=Topomyia yanbarensis TaxID=2498891 RepID=UPI00273AC170|nr:uncharacterized protein LOC131681014 [Topomyia yanbarensis]